MQVNPYLTFNGNCREAMCFYQECLGGDLLFQTIGESPLSGELPEQVKNLILHATLIKGKLIIMASDVVGEDGLLQGNTVVLLLHCNSEKEIKNCYKKLSRGGVQHCPVETNFYGALHGNLTDKYGYNWMLNYQM